MFACVQTDGVDASPSHSRQQEVNHVDITVSTTASTSTVTVVNGDLSRDESPSDVDNCYSTTPVVPRNHHVADDLSGVNSAVSTPLLERSYDSQGVRPKMRKKRAAPRPPQEESKVVALVIILKN